MALAGCLEATMRELNQQTAEVTGAVERGETVTVTEDGRHVATILPPDLAEPHCLSPLVPAELDYLAHRTLGTGEAMGVLGVVIDRCTIGR
ncbi:hypothetical protein AB0I39_34555 [Kitasatospora purpeofusca]|uniref:type II toxin-antitoxin system Phd/YefM family antitoxin n=1 Tax=Kitasatospora purpeofusca TaxID=67352 RepID=UPI0033C45D98